MLQTVPIAVHAPVAGEALLFDGAQWIPGAVPPDPPPAVTGTGFPHVTGGAWDPAAKLVENADVHAAAAIAWNKISKAGAVAADVGAAPAAEGVTNGNIHDHVGGDGAQIDHGGLAGLADNDHPQYAPAGQGVTNGDAHDHAGGDGAQIDHTGLANKGTNTHPQIDTHLAAAAPHSGHEVTSAKGAANGYAGLDASILLNGDQLPAMTATKKGGVPATGTPASKFLRDDATWQTIGGSVPTGTGFRHVVAGVEDGAAKLVENNDVAAAAAIAESKLNLGYPTHSNANDPAANEKAALPGTSGTPGAGNKYVTDADARNSDVRTPASHGIADAAKHSSAATPGKLLKADASGLPADAANTDAEVAAAVTASHAAISLAADADVLLGLSGQQITLDPQVANRVLAGPVSGADADPAFRALVAGDVPDLSGTYAPASKGVTNGDSHDHNGGDGAQIDHGGLGGLADDDHPQYIKHSLAETISDFLVASGAGAFIKKTLAEVKTILGLGSAAYTASTDYAVAAKGVTGGDAHDHVGGDGAQIDHGGLAGLADDDHPQYAVAGHVHSIFGPESNGFVPASGTMSGLRFLTNDNGYGFWKDPYALNIAPGTGNSWGITLTTVAGGETLVAKDVVYLKASDSKWWKAKADAAATSGPVPVAIVVTGGTAGQPVVLLIQGVMEVTGWGLTVGAQYFISAGTAGLITLTPPGTATNIIRALGFAMTATALHFNPSTDFAEKS